MVMNWEDLRRPIYELGWRQRKPDLYHKILKKFTIYSTSSKERPTIKMAC